MSPPADDMHCSEVLDRLEALIDDDLDAETTEALQHHLGGCDSCARELEHARRTLTELRGLPELEPPARVIERARTDSSFSAAPRARRPIGRAGWIATAAAVVLATAGVLTIGRHSAPTNDPEAVRAAAEVELALACLGDITRRANRMVKAQIVDQGAVPSSMRGLARSLGPLTTLESTGGILTEPPEHNLEGSS
jgi:anti-sigma factor RsiW